MRIVSLISVEVKDKHVFRRRFERFLDGDYTPFMLASGQSVVRDLAQHIRNQQQADEEAPLPRNEQSTLDRKAKLGRGDKSLIDTGRLLKPSSYDIKAEKQNAEISVNDSVRPEKGWWWFEKYKFFAISPKVRKKIYNDFLKYVRSSFFGKS